MNKDPKKLLEDINSKILQKDIFKYKREVLVQYLIYVLNSFVLIYEMNGDLNYVNQAVDQYRAILKFIFSEDNENGVIPEDDKVICDSLTELFEEFIKQYTPVRNYLEQCSLATRQLDYDKETNTFFEKSHDDYSLYTRMQVLNSDGRLEANKQDVIKDIGEYLIEEKYKINLFKDQFIQRCMEDFIDICWSESEIKFDHDFGDFKYSDIISFCAALKLIANYYEIIILRKPSTFSISASEMIEGISRLTKLSSEKVKKFLQYQTYDYNYQKDKLTLFQGLIKCNDRYYFAPITISNGFLPMKMYRIITDYDNEKYEKDISIIANEKEKQMTEEVTKILQKYDVSYEINYKLIENKQVVAEYDMLVFDNKTSNLYVIELKWFFVGDGEKEHKYLNGKIKEAIKHRLEKDQFIKDNPQEFCNLVFKKDKVNDVYELLISQNYGGSTKHRMEVIDFLTLQNGSEKYDSFDELMKYLFAKEYMKEINIKTIPTNIEMVGYKFRIYQPYHTKE